MSTSTTCNKKMAGQYNTTGKKVDYKVLNSSWPNIPNLRRRKVEDLLYPVEVMKRAQNRVKISLYYGVATNHTIEYISTVAIANNVYT